MEGICITVKAEINDSVLRSEIVMEMGKFSSYFICIGIAL